VEICITFEEHGFPVELLSEKDIEKAVRTGRLRRETIVSHYKAEGDVVLGRADGNAILRPFLGIAEGEAPKEIGSPPPPAVKPAAAPDGAPAAAVPAVPPALPSAGPSRAAAALTKGANVNLSTTVPGLASVRVSLGWEPRANVTADLDVDACTFLLTAKGKTRSDADFVFYNNNSAADGAVVRGDSGRDKEDRETVVVALDRLPADIERLSFAMSIYDASARRQSFKLISSAFIRVADGRDGGEIARYDLREDGSPESAMIFGEIYRHRGDWKFKAVGQGFVGGIVRLADFYGVDIDA
jgi:tellurium resistance protein TerD